MPILDTVAPKRQSYDGPKGSNKVELPNGTRAAKIVDIRIFNVTVTKEGERHIRRFTKDESPDKNVAVRFQLAKRTDIVLQREWPLFLGKNAGFAKFIEALTGLRAGSEEIRQFNTDELLDTDCLVTTDFNGTYTNIVAVTPLPVDDDLADVPAHQPEPPKITVDPVAIKRRLTSLLRSPELEEWEKQKAIGAVTGRADKASITSPEIALSVCEKLEALLEAARDEVPF